MATNYTIRPTQIETGAEVFLVRHIGTNRTAISRVTFVSRTSDEPIAKLTEADFYIVKDIESEEDVRIIPSCDPKNPHLKLADAETNVRVSFWEITEDSIALKKVSDEANTLRQRAADAKAAEKAIRETEATARKEARSSKTTVAKVTDLEKLNKKIAILTKRQMTQAADLERTQIALKEATEELSKITSEETSEEVSETDQVEAPEDTTETQTEEVAEVADSEEEDSAEEATA